VTRLLREFSNIVIFFSFPLFFFIPPFSLLSFPSFRPSFISVSILINFIFKNPVFPHAMLGGSLSPQHGASSGCGWRNDLQLWRLAANILNKQPRTNNKGWSSSLGVGLTTLHHKNNLVTKNLTEPRTWTDSLDKRPKLRNMDMRFGTWNVRSWRGGMGWCGLDWSGYG
jgi:hypothetical protein